MSKKVLTKPEIAAYERIRSYVIGQMSKSGDSSMQLASYRALAKQFDVSAPTVLKALKDLIEDGFLTVKPGIGTFTNQARLGSAQNVRLIGCFSGDGRNVLMDRSYWQILPVFADALLRKSSAYRLQHCFLGSGKLTVDNINTLGLDGIVWFSPTPEIASRIGILKQIHLPLLSIMGKCPGVSSYYFDNESDNFMVASRMLDEGRRKIVLLLPSDGDDGAVRGYEKAHAAARVTNDAQCIIRDSAEERSMFSRTLQTMQPDGIIFNCSISHYWPSLKGNALTDRIRLYTGIYPLHDDMEYAGWAGVPALEQDAVRAAENFENQFTAGEAAEILQQPFQTQIHVIKK